MGGDNVCVNVFIISVTLDKHGKSQCHDDAECAVVLEFIYFFYLPKKKRVKRTRHALEALFKNNILTRKYIYTNKHTKNVHTQHHTVK